MQSQVTPHAIVFLPSSDGMEMLLCYEDEGVYVNTYGRIIKDVVLQWGEMPTSVGESLTDTHTHTHTHRTHNTHTHKLISPLTHKCCVYTLAVRHQTIRPHSGSPIKTQMNTTDYNPIVSEASGSSSLLLFFM